MIDLHFKYVRIQGKELAKNTMQAKGIFSMCWQLLRDGELAEEDEAMFREVDSWFAKNLPWPPQCINQEPVVCWFKTENSDEMLEKIKPALWLVKKYDHPYYLVFTNDPGEIVYEDHYQVAVKVERQEVEELQESWYAESTSS